MILVNLSDVAERWSLSKTAIIKMIKNGHLSPFRQFKGGYYVFDLKHVQEVEKLRAMKIINNGKIAEIVEKIFGNKI